MTKEKDTGIQRSLDLYHYLHDFLGLKEIPHKLYPEITLANTIAETMLYLQQNVDIKQCFMAGSAARLLPFPKSMERNTAIRQFFQHTTRMSGDHDVDQVLKVLTQGANLNFAYFTHSPDTVMRQFLTLGNNILQDASYSSHVNNGQLVFQMENQQLGRENLFTIPETGQPVPIWELQGNRGSAGISVELLAYSSGGIPVNDNRYGTMFCQKQNFMLPLTMVDHTGVDYPTICVDADKIQQLAVASRIEGDLITNPAIGLTACARTIRHAIDTVPDNVTDIDSLIAPDTQNKFNKLFDGDLPKLHGYRMYDFTAETVASVYKNPERWLALCKATKLDRLLNGSEVLNKHADVAETIKNILSKLVYSAPAEITFE